MNHFWSQIVKKLDYIAMKEESMKASMQESLVKKVSAVVAQEFAKNKDFQEHALAEAMATIGSKPTLTSADSWINRSPYLLKFQIMLR